MKYYQIHNDMLVEATKDVELHSLSKINHKIPKGTIIRIAIDNYGRATFKGHDGLLPIYDLVTSFKPLENPDDNSNWTAIMAAVTFGSITVYMIFLVIFNYYNKL